MNRKKLFLETYGCQMNFSDSEIVVSILKDNNYDLTQEYKEADIILMNTCSIRDHAEQRVLNRLNEFKSLRNKKPEVLIGIIGCMAERMKDDLLNKENVDLVIGPDAYRDIPKLIEEKISKGQKAINVVLSNIETYDDINPIRYDSNGISAFISIMRGCENFCSYCVVPYTRGKERSRNPKTIIKEAQDLFDKGYREITLLGQNVNSYKWEENNESVDFPELLEQTALISNLLRIRFATSHPKDLSDKLLHTISRHENICDFIHLPFQSGNSRILEKMNRGYNRDWYLNRIHAIKTIIPNCGLSTDVIAGFCSETEEEHQDTLSLMKEVGYDFAYMFKYSERPNTYAWKKYEDDIPEAIKGRRLQEVIDLQQELSLQSNKKDIGKTFNVLVEGTSKKSKERLVGRNSQNKVIIFDKKNYKAGDYVNVKVINCTAATLLGEAI
ncbi:MAG: tRNA (N6-isopentenyl adenosine(37)-C2)-methylthiotransferase MiaB [Bacteroidota bacterium]